jgi:hypothetical protein
MTPDFESFPDIKKLGKAALYITQKIHGSNAQIYVFRNTEYVTTLESMPDEARAAKLSAEYPGKELTFEQRKEGGVDMFTTFTDLACGSRSQWVVPGKDNFGFAEMVYAHKQEFIDKLGLGRHYGEWAGPGINSGEGLTQKYFILFDHWRYPEGRPLPPNTKVVPVLYDGPFDMGQVAIAMNDLRANGSKLVPGFMAPEGVVVRIKGERYKVVFQDEEAKWKNHKDPIYAKQKGEKTKLAIEKYGHLLQPIRLEKLLSRDEVYLREYPKSMGKIADAYFDDLVKEDQVQGNELELAGIRNQYKQIVFPFIQEIADKTLAQNNVP